MAAITKSVFIALCKLDQSNLDACLPDVFISQGCHTVLTEFFASVHPSLSEVTLLLCCMDKNVWYNYKKELHCVKHFKLPLHDYLDNPLSLQIFFESSKFRCYSLLQQHIVVPFKLNFHQ